MYNVNVFPKIEMETSVSSDGRYIFIIPKNNWNPGIDCKFSVKAKIAKKGFFGRFFPKLSDEIFLIYVLGYRILIWV